MHFRDLAQVKQNMDRNDPYIKVNNFQPTRSNSNITIHNLNLLDQIKFQTYLMGGGGIIEIEVTSTN